MKINIFDVAHGFCAFVVADNGNTMLIDCGHNDEVGFYPGEYLEAIGCTGIERFFPLNYDEDHLSGLPNLLRKRNVPVGILHRNPSITPETVRAMKEEGDLGPGVEALIGMLKRYTGPVVSPPDYAGITFEVFYNRYPNFSDTNNLSLVLFLHYDNLSVVFPGDLEVPGWRTLLEDAKFQENLSRVNVFVASHHGRKSGYCKEVFEFCSPEIIIVSDESIQYDTQETNYSVHATGIQWGNAEVRKVLSTRNDGTIIINKVAGDLGRISAAPWN